MPRVITITTRTTVYTLDELTPENRERAIENVSTKLTGEWWDTHNNEQVAETIVAAFAHEIGEPVWKSGATGHSDYPGIDGVKLDGWDIDRTECVLFDGKLTRDNAPALPWVDGIEAVELDAKRDHTYLSVEETDPECTCTGDASFLSPHLDGCPFNAPNPSTPDQHRTLIDAVKEAMRAAWKAGYDEGQYIGSEEYATEDIEANERLFLADGTLYTGPDPDDDNSEETTP